MHMAYISFSSLVKYSFSFTNINNLPNDLLGEIFIRLPFRSIAKCKCVCKNWLGLISKPSFPTQIISHHRSLFKAHLTFISPYQLMLSFLPPYLNEYDDQIQRVFSSPDMLIEGNICGYSNGLFLCCNNRYTSGQGYFVYDPLTKECTHISPSSKSNQEECLYAVGFACHDYYLAGEGTHYFSVVIMKSFIQKQYDFEVEVFSSRLGTWRQILVSDENGFAFAPHWMLGVVLNGDLHFMGSSSILSIDPRFGSFCIIDYPVGVNAMNIINFGYLGCSGGSLRIADIHQNDLRVWKLFWRVQRNLNDLYPIWRLVHKTNLSTHLPAKFCDNYFKRIGGFHPYDGDIVYLHSYVDGLYVGNLQTNKFKLIPGYDKFYIIPFQLEFPDPSPIPYEE